MNFNSLKAMGFAGLLAAIGLMAANVLGQDSEDAKAETEDGKSTASALSRTSEGGGQTIIITPGGKEEKTPFLFSTSILGAVEVRESGVRQSLIVNLKPVQGEAKVASLEIKGPGRIESVEGKGVSAWSVRRKGAQRFLDLKLELQDDQAESSGVAVNILQEFDEMPETLFITHIAPGDSLGFNATLKLKFSRSVTGKLARANGFSVLDTIDGERGFQTFSGGELAFKLRRRGAVPLPVEMVESALVGRLDNASGSVSFKFSGTAIVSEPGARLRVLSGRVAMGTLPESDDYQLVLAGAENDRFYELVFEEVGSYPVTLEFVAGIQQEVSASQQSSKTADAEWQGIDCAVASSAVVPLKLQGFEEDIQWRRGADLVTCRRSGVEWESYLPATGHIRLQWKNARTQGEGKLFFTTNALIESQLGPGLLKQHHQVSYRVLQGELESLEFELQGPGEILDVEGANLLAWKVADADEGEGRRLKITLSQPMSGTIQVSIRSQTPLDTFPVRVVGTTVTPIGAIRHAGTVRLSNMGSVRIEPTELSGLTQLAPEQYPGTKIAARQVFVYRFPSADYGFTLSADRIQPEVNIAHVLLYQLSESDRVVRADIELDIREASIREWNFGIPSDYSIVSVSAAGLADYIASSEDGAATRNLKVIFGKEVQGRQLVTLQLEKNDAALAGTWQLPRIAFPEAKDVRGDIGIVGAPGFRMTGSQTQGLTEKPLSYFPKPIANLQQAFRLRDADWSASVEIELLERNIQSDVFHLYSLSQGAIYGSSLINYFVTGAPASEWRLTVPEALGNVTVDGQDIRTWRREGDTLVVSLHQPVMGSYTLLVTFEEKPNEVDGSFQAGQVTPLDVQGDRGFVQVVSPMQVELENMFASSQLLVLDPLELPAEFRLLSTAPALGTWQYTSRPFDLKLKVTWFQPGTTAAQVVEFSEASSRVSKDGELVTDVLYYVKSRGQRTLRIDLPGEPVRLWAVSVNGQPVTARQADKATLIPLPGGADPNVPVEVALRLGKPAVDEKNPELVLPTVYAPVLKTQWSIASDENYVLVPTGGSVQPAPPVLWPNGFQWVAASGLMQLAFVTLLAFLGAVVGRRTGLTTVISTLLFGGAVFACGLIAMEAFNEIEPLPELQLSVPVLAAGETVGLQVQNMPGWLAYLNWPGVTMAIVGLLAVLFLAKFAHDTLGHRGRIALVAALLTTSVGLLFQTNGAFLFFAFIGVAGFFLMFLPAARNAIGYFVKLNADAVARRKNRRAKAEAETDKKGENSGGDAGTVATTVFALLAGSLAFFGTASAGGSAFAAEDDSIRAASSIVQSWQINSDSSPLNAQGEVKVSGEPGDRFVLLRAPAIMTKFSGEGLRLVKRDVPGLGLCYLVTIPLQLDEDAEVEGEMPENGKALNQDVVKLVTLTAKFEYQVEAVSMRAGLPVLTGTAAVQEVTLDVDQSNWEVKCEGAAKIEKLESDSSTKARVLLGPDGASIVVTPKGRNVSNEETKFFVEGSNLYLPGPGVVDGRHRIYVSTSQGKVRELTMLVPEGLTVSGVSGWVGNWQFDSESRKLDVEVAEAAPASFNVIVETQRGLDPLPAEVTLSPLRVESAEGEVGLIGVAFGNDAQPESVEADSLTQVNLGDFDSLLMQDVQSVLHRVYRYGAKGGSLSLRVAPVSPEVRAISKQVLSFGDERVVLGINFVADITRAGLFKLSFDLPEGLEVESLSGDALHHWSEIDEAGVRRVVLHLNGQTIGAQKFALTLGGATPTDVTDWAVPRFVVNEAARQTGELVVRPITGIRLRTISRQNVSEADPRSMGATEQGALAFRLLQQDWSLQVGIEKLAPWVTGQVLHDVTVREGQTRSTLIADFRVQNASIRTLQVVLPITDSEEIKTVRATGKSVSDFVRTAEDSNVWELKFKRRMVGRIQFQIEYERRGDRADAESLVPIEFPESRQLGYYFSVRAGGRLEIETGPMSQGWQIADWNSVPQTLRDSGKRTTPALALRAVATTTPLAIRVIRHSLAEALKLRVAEGTLTTVLSPTGDQLTAVDVRMEVIQRSSLTVKLPVGGDLFSIFVNGESVHSIRQGEDDNAWQFYILPGMDDRFASVRFVYSLTGSGIDRMNLVSPQLNVPLENMKWSVIAPRGYELSDHDGNLELVGRDNRESYDRDSYLSKASGKRQVQAQQAAQMLQQANDFLQLGEQTKARRALNSVTNYNALDAASNEDARVQLENLQTQQAIVGLNTRRQRLYLDNSRSDASVADNEQLRQAASINPILQEDQLNFRPQELSQLLAGNSSEDNAVLQQIAGRLVMHQHTTEPAPQAILISLPEEGTVYDFSRSVQVAEDAPLELELAFSSNYQLPPWKWALIGGLLFLFAAGLFYKPASVGKASESVDQG